MKNKTLKITGWTMYVSGLLLCASDPASNELILKQIIGLVLVIISLPILLGSLGGLND